MPIVRPATPAEQEARDRDTYAAWGEHVSLEQYLAREAMLRRQAWAVRALETWLLVEGETILCSCESLAMASTVGKEPGQSFGIASVYTAPEHRGRRYASRLVDQVGTRLLERPGAQAVVLYSEVGAPIYERSGFVVRPIDDWIVPAAPSHQPAVRVDDELTPERDAPGAARASLVLRLSAPQLDWHLARERFYAATRNRRAPGRHRLSIAGSVLLLGADLKHGELLVLDAHVAAQEVEPLLRAAGDLAWQLGLASAKLWALDGLAPPAWVEVKPCVSSLPMIRSSIAQDWKRLQRGGWV